jgi:hypothetical protein
MQNDVQRQKNISERHTHEAAKEEIGKVMDCTVGKERRELISETHIQKDANIKRL